MWSQQAAATAQRLVEAEESAYRARRGAEAAVASFPAVGPPSAWQKQSAAQSAREADVATERAAAAAVWHQQAAHPHAPITSWGMRRRSRKNRKSRKHFKGGNPHTCSGAVSENGKTMTCDTCSKVYSVKARG